eukprot:TRINITY_DN46915_c0_g1_i1.p1 TRINITY_DN46915_c0_g1~~TRINITY_DN46915_c0_g1_i1.p1  ORF type:complete len:280 (-),score=22.90 TRINITY_DN46915_c0_g1_i1:94-906(-)
MSYRAPFATLPVESPPWHKERPRWSVSDRFGRNITDIMLDGPGFHAGYINYNSIHETPKRLAKRLAQRKAGLTGSIKWKTAEADSSDDWDVGPSSPQQSRLPTPIGSSPSSSPASGAVTSPRASCSPTSPSRAGRSTAAASTRRPASRTERRLTATDLGASPKTMSRCNTAPTPEWSKTLSRPVEMNTNVWSDSFEKMYRDRDKRHRDWNAQAFYEDIRGTLTKPPHFSTTGPAHPFAAVHDSPSTKWSATFKGNTLSTITRESMSVPGI